MKILFDTHQNGFIEEMHRTDGHTCRDCRYRERWELNQYSQKVVQWKRLFGNRLGYL